jgi:hypothetical protein
MQPEHASITFVADVQNIIMSLGTQLSSKGKPVELDQEAPTAATSTEALLDPGSTVSVYDIVYTIY